MRLFSYACLLAGYSIPALAADSTKYPATLKLTYEIIGSDGQHALAEVRYDPATLKSHLASWTPPPTDKLKTTSPGGTSAPLVRVSLPDGTSTVTSLTSFDPSLSQYINLWLSSGPNPEIFSASISPISPPPLSEEEIRQKRKEERARAKGKPIPSPKPKPKAKPKTKKGKKEEPEQGPGGPIVEVTIKRASEGPRPKLISRPPPQVDGEGREIRPEEVPEKTFFQKYWWVFMVGTILMMTGGGDGK